MKNENSKLEKKIKKVRVLVDKGEKGEYEDHNWIVKIIRVPIIFILNLLPAKIGKRLFLGKSNSNSDTKKVFRSVTTHKALEVMYTYPKRKKEKKTTISDNFWENFLTNARAVRNRLNLFKKNLKGIIGKLSESDDNIKLLSLGSRSARGVFEVIRDKSRSAHLKLIDISQEAIDDGKKLIKKINLDEEKIKVDFCKDYVQNLEKYCDDFRPNIVEMVGLLDYLSEQQGADLIGKVYSIINPGGYFITCNVAPNMESPFVTKGINWPLIYRTPENLAKILIKAGFLPENIILINEPLKVHCLAIAKR